MKTPRIMSGVRVEVIESLEGGKEDVQYGQMVRVSTVHDFFS